MYLHKPVIMPDEDGEPLHSVHRRKNRNIIPDDESSIHLCYICDKFLSDHVEEFNKHHLLQVLENLNEPKMFNFIKIFIEKGYRILC